MDNVEEIKEKISIARSWANDHFRAEHAENSKLINDDLTLAKPCCFVEFPTPDIMKVSPSILGMKSDITWTYRLAFLKNGLRWDFQSMSVKHMIIPKNRHRPFPNLDVI